MVHSSQAKQLRHAPRQEGRGIRWALLVFPALPSPALRLLLLSMPIPAWQCRFAAFTCVDTVVLPKCLPQASATSTTLRQHKNCFQYCCAKFLTMSCLLSVPTGFCYINDIVLAILELLKVHQR